MTTKRDQFREALYLEENPSPHNSTFFKTKSGTIVAIAYRRVVVGDRGPYIEFAEEDIIPSAFEIPENQKWRVNDPKWRDRVFYIELRSKDKARVKLYKQVRPVNYADYKVGMYYIHPAVLQTDTQRLLYIGEIPEDSK